MGIHLIAPLFEVVIAKKAYQLVVKPLNTHCLGSADAWISRQKVPGELWSIIHGSIGTHISWTSPVNDVRIQTDNQIDKYRYLFRSILTFDTTSIPVGANIKKVVASFKTVVIVNTLNALASIGWFESTPGNVCDFVLGDYQQFGTVVLSETKLLNDLVAYTWYHLEFNATGRGKINKGGITCLGLREATFDAPNIEPTWISLKNAQVQMNSADSVGDEPYLTIDYEV